MNNAVKESIKTQIESLGFCQNAVSAVTSWLQDEHKPAHDKEIVAYEFIETIEGGSTVHFIHKRVAEGDQICLFLERIDLTIQDIFFLHNLGAIAYANFEDLFIDYEENT